MRHPGERHAEPAAINGPLRRLERLLDASDSISAVQGANQALTSSSPRFRLAHCRRQSMQAKEFVLSIMCYCLCHPNVHGRTQAPKGVMRPF